MTTGKRSHQVPKDSLIQKGDSSSQQVRERASGAQRNPLKCRSQLRSTTLSTGKNLGLNSGLLQEAEGESDHLPETASNCLLGWGRVSGLRSGMEVLCHVRVYKFASLRQTPAVIWVRSLHPQVRGEFIRSRVSPKRVSGLTRAEESPKSPGGKWQEKDEVSAFPKPFLLCVYLAIW
jgi:hypothetical protein